MRREVSHQSRRMAGNRVQSLSAAALAAVATLALVNTASAIPNNITYYTDAGTGNWFDAANWTLGVPGPQSQTRVASSGTITINGDATADQTWIGYGDNVNPTLYLGDGQSLTTYGQLTLGGSGAIAGSNNNLTTFNQTGGSVDVHGAFPMYISFVGSAIYNMSGGTIQVAGPQFASTGNLGLAIGTGVSAAATNSGTLNLSGGVITSDGIFQVARQGAAGTVNMTGGTIDVGLDAWLGQGTASAGGGGLVTFTQSAGTLSVGYDAFSQTNYGNLYLGIANPSTKRASYTLSGSGAIDVYGAFYAGGGYGGTITAAGGIGGYGDFVMNGGSMSIGGAGQTIGGAMNIGRAFGANAVDGTVTLNSGVITMNVPGSVLAVGSYEGNAASSAAAFPTQSGTLSISGGQLLAPTSVLSIGRPTSATAAVPNYGATGTLNLSGGELSVNSLQWKNTNHNANVRTFNWTGGIFDVNSEDSDYVLTNAGGTLRPGGAKIQTFTAASSSADGSYTQNSGTLALDVASNASYDAVDLSAAGVGAVQLNGGTVQVTALGGYTPTFGASIAAITGKTVSDSATWSLPTLTTGNTWDRRISADGANQVETLVAVRSNASTLTSGADWTSGSWDAGTPNATDASAKLAGSGGAVSIAAPGVTVGYLQLDGSSPWTVNGPGTLTIATSGSNVGGIVAFGAQQTIAAPVQFAGNHAVVATQLKSANVTFSGDISGSGTVEQTGPGAVTLSSSTSPFTGTWSVSGGSLNIDSDANIGAPAASVALDNATVNSSGAWNSARSIVLNAGGGTINAGADSTLSGVISGAGGLTKLGSSALVLSGANSYSGATTISAGTLGQGAANAIPANSAVAMTSGSTLDLSGYTTAFASLSGAGSVINSSSSLTIGTNALASSSTTFVGTIAGGGAFTKDGPGTQVVAAPSGASGLYAFDGSVAVTGGTLQVTGLVPTKFDLLPATQAFGQPISVSSGATLALGGTAGLVYSSITGAGSLSVVSGSIILTSPSDYSGGTTLVNAPSVTVDDMTAFGTGPVHFVASATADRTTAGSIIFDPSSGGGVFANAIQVDADKYARLYAQGQSIELAQAITGGGGFEFSSGLLGGQFVLDQPSTYNGTCNVDANVTIVQNVDNGLAGNATIANNGTIDLNNHNLTLGLLIGSGQVKLTSSAADNGNLTINTNYDGSFTSTVAGAISGTGGLTKTGGGVQTLTEANGNTYSGPTLIEQGGLQISGNINGLSPATSVTVSSDASLIFATTAVASGLTAGTPVTYSGNIAGAGEVQMNSKNESLVLSGTNTYSGGTRLALGTVLVSADSNLGDASGPIAFFAGSTTPVLKYNTGFTSGRNVLLENGVGAIDTNGNNATLASVSGPGAFQKLGAGTLGVNSVLAGGTLDVANGVLQIAPSGGAASGTSKITGAVTVEAGAQLDLTDNKLITSGTALGTWNGTAYTGVQGLVASGRAGGTWTGSGIITSQSLAATPSILTTLGVAQADDIGKVGQTFGGQSVSSGDVLVMYTYAGDANLDGRINGDDYFAIDSHVNVVGASGYENGDFNLDGRINGDDYFLIDSNINNQSLGVIASSSGLVSGVSAVPEPAELGLGIMLASFLSRRRRRGA